MGDTGMQAVGGASVQTAVRLPVRSEASPEARELLAYLARHCEDATLAAAAAHAGCHPNTLEHRVYQATGRTFGDVLHEMRMQRAASLLEAAVPVAQVARLCSYRDGGRFREAFKRRWGEAPARWRSRYAKEGAAR